MRALLAAVLLVAQDEQEQRGGRIGFVRRDERGDAHRDAALHVECAAAPDVPVDELARERRMRPALAGRGHDVDVAVQDQGRSTVRAGVPGNEVGATRRSLVALALDAVGPEQRLDVRDAGFLVARRVGGVEADQLSRELDRVDHSCASASSRRSTSDGVL
jgi:hypothetical protein